MYALPSGRTSKSKIWTMPGVADQRRGPRLVEEALDDLVLVRQLGAQDLDRRPPRDALVLGEVDHAHAALAQLPTMR